jgi:hypothetical protein
MTDPRQQRINTLAAAARAKSQAKTLAAEQAIRTLTKQGQGVTFQAVGREAGVSHSFLYSTPTLRGRIEHLRRQNQPAPQPAQPRTDADNVVLTLTDEISRLKKQAREQAKTLRDALAQAHGENLELRRQLSQQPPTLQPGHDATPTPPPNP